ncbi:hypothetical protein RSAG8_13919, partial [Rhizoctonia solani AG-8 WAC10335]
METARTHGIVELTENE